MYKTSYRYPVLNVTIDRFLKNEPLYVRKNGNTRTAIGHTSRQEAEQYRMFQSELTALWTGYKNVPQNWHTFYIPKKTGGQRKIDAPSDELKQVQWKILDLFNTYFPDMHHTSAFAYVKNRSTIDCLKRHTGNKSKFYMKIDFKDFFGSFSGEDVIRLMREVSPFGTGANRTPFGITPSTLWLMSVATKDGRLVQGSPLSPMLTNIIMIPFDHILCNRLKKKKIIYTRYCDDIILSSKKRIDTHEIIGLVDSVIREKNYPLRINYEKTRVGSVNGRNWNLGLMINGSNRITVGHEQKKIMKASLHHAIMKIKAGELLQKEEATHLFGVLNYYRSVEIEYFTYVLDWFKKKYQIDIYDELKKYQ